MIYTKENGKYKSCNPETKRKENKLRMYVNGKHVPKTHPLHKPGRYKNFEQAAFSSLSKYDSSVEGQVYAITNVNNRRKAESQAHTELQKSYERKGEWFKCTPEQAREVVSSTAEEYK